MTKNIYMTKDDTKPDLFFTVKYVKTGLPVNITGCTVNFNIKFRGATGLKNSGHTLCTLTDPTNGVCKYTWTAADTDTNAMYTAELQITWVDTTVQTCRPSWNLYIMEDLD
jgi:hypothetical protein